MTRVVLGVRAFDVASEPMAGKRLRACVAALRAERRVMHMQSRRPPCTLVARAPSVMVFALSHAATAEMCVTVKDVA